MPAARISTPSSLSELTIDQVLTPPVKSTARLPCQPRPVGGDGRAALRLLFRQQPLHPVLHDPFLQAVDDIVQLAGDVAQRLGRIGHAVEGLLQVGHAVGLLHLLGKIGQSSWSR